MEKKCMCWQNEDHVANLHRVNVSLKILNHVADHVDCDPFLELWPFRMMVASVLREQISDIESIIIELKRKENEQTLAHMSAAA